MKLVITVGKFNQNVITVTLLKNDFKASFQHSRWFSIEIKSNYLFDNVLIFKMQSSAQTVMKEILWRNVFLEFQQKTGFRFSSSDMNIFLHKLLFASISIKVRRSDSLFRIFALYGRLNLDKFVNWWFKSFQRFIELIIRVIINMNNHNRIDV